MLRIILLLSTIGLVKSSGIGAAPLQFSGSIASVGPPITPPANAPVVTAASSQYFERTFNRLVVPPVIVAPIAPVAPPPLSPVIPIAPVPTVFVEPTRTVPVAVNPQPPPAPPEPVQPNVAVAVATAHAAAPVATILLPPYPFGFPPNFGFTPSEQPVNIPNENTKEPTTQRTTQQEVATTSAPATTTPIDASNSDNNFVQALPSNENVNYNLYGPPPQGVRPQFQPLPQPQNPNGQFQPQQPNPQFQPQQSKPGYQNQPNLQFQPQLPNQQFQPRRPNWQVQPQLPNSQIQPYRPNPQLELQQPNSLYQPQRPNLQFQGQQPNPQFRLQNSNTHLKLQPQNLQFQPQEPEFPPYPPRQQLQSNQQYLPPQQRQQKRRPQKLKTSVEVVPVPLAYITPPPLQAHKTHAHIKVVKHIYSYVPASSSRLILKPVKIHPVRLVKHKVGVRLQNLRAENRDIEMTTINPFRRPNTKPPRV